LDFASQLAMHRPEHDVSHQICDELQEGPRAELKARLGSARFSLEDAAARDSALVAASIVEVDVTGTRALVVWSHRETGDEQRSWEAIDDLSDCEQLFADLVDRQRAAREAEASSEEDEQQVGVVAHTSTTEQPKRSRRSKKRHSAQLTARCSDQSRRRNIPRHEHSSDKSQHKEKDGSEAELEAEDEEVDEDCGSAIEDEPEPVCEHCGRTASDFAGGRAGLRSHIPQCRKRPADSKRRTSSSPGAQAAGEPVHEADEEVEEEEEEEEEVEKEEEEEEEEVEEEEDEPSCPYCGRRPADFAGGCAGLRSHIPQCRKRPADADTRRSSSKSTRAAPSSCDEGDAHGEQDEVAEASSSRMQEIRDNDDSAESDRAFKRGPQLCNRPRKTSGFIPGQQRGNVYCCLDDESPSSIAAQRELDVAAILEVIRPQLESAHASSMQHDLAG
jgi:hypothetical protein